MLTKLKPFVPRKYLPAEIDLTSISALTPVYERLEHDLLNVGSPTELINWLASADEVAAAIDEASSIIYIRMTCQTDDPAREKAYLEIVETLNPWLKPRNFRLQQLFVQSPFLNDLPPHYGLYLRSITNSVALYREENIARQTQEDKLTQEYGKLMGSLTVSFDDQEQTLVQMARIQEETDRDRRKAAWELVTRRRFQESEKLDSLFDQLLAIRIQIAQEAGFSNYLEYTFAAKERFHYTPATCLAFHQTVEDQVVPLLRALEMRRQEALGVGELRPWDLAVDPKGNKPLKPFQSVQELMGKSARIFAKLDPRLSDYFAELQGMNLIDLENRKGKAPGGYQATLRESRRPFIFMNAVGVQGDVETLLHEAGHAFHSLACSHQVPLGYREGVPMEFCEVASMSMELLSSPYFEEFYSSEDATRARQELLEGAIKLLPWVATVDAFQHWIYTNPGHTAAERRAQWASTLDRFAGPESYQGYEDIRSTTWHRQLHIFELPFYYIEYGIAQLGALQLWKNSKQNVAETITKYLTALSLGGSKSLPELFQTAGITFGFTAETIGPLMTDVRKELGL